MRCRVIKVGGSLLSNKKLPELFSSWFNRQEPAEQTIVIVGGGTIVDQIREYDQRFPLSCDSSHWLAIQAMGITAGVFCEIVPRFKNVESLPESSENGEFVLAPYQHLRKQNELPCGWHVTSDSIAAVVAAQAMAAELVLIKSRPLVHDSIEEASKAGFVDQHFPVVASRCAAVRFDVLGRP